jgi:hypothetical protein
MHAWLLLTRLKAVPGMNWSGPRPTATQIVAAARKLDREAFWAGTRKPRPRPSTHTRAVATTRRGSATPLGGICRARGQRRRIPCPLRRNKPKPKTSARRTIRRFLPGDIVATSKGFVVLVGRAEQHQSATFSLLLPVDVPRRRTVRKSAPGGPVRTDGRGKVAALPKKSLAMPCEPLSPWAPGPPGPPGPLAGPTGRSSSQMPGS